MENEFGGFAFFSQGRMDDVLFGSGFVMVAVALPVWLLKKQSDVLPGRDLKCTWLHDLQHSDV